MLEWINKHKILTVVAIVMITIIIIFIIPLVINKVYYLKAPCEFFNVKYDISSVLDYYGAVLTFIGTISLGSVTIYQNYQSQQKTDEVNRLTLELQKKSMKLAEQVYEKEKLHESKRNIPKFEVILDGSMGSYMSSNGILKNVSSSIATAIKSVSFQVFKEEEEEVSVIESNKVKISKSSLNSFENARIDFNNAPFIYENEEMKCFTLIWKFQCEDDENNVHYYKATIRKENDKNIYGDLWKVEKIG